MSWDIALSEIEFGDYSACVVLLIRKEIVYILGVMRGRFPFEALKKKVMELKRRYSPSTLLIEDSPISLGLIQSLREQSINVTTYNPDTDKRARLIAQTDLFAGGSVRLPRRAGWLEEFVAELLSFPGRHDDQVDALTQGLAWGRQQWSRKVVVSPAELEIPIAGEYALADAAKAHEHLVAGHVLGKIVLRIHCLKMIREVTPSTEGCEDCLRIGSTWVHLRLCLTCGHVGCCDSSPNKHARKHFHATKHPIIQSFEPGEDWRWCYVHEAEV